jgi:hypothetical protein
LKLLKNWISFLAPELRKVPLDMKGILKIPNFQIPNITMGCIKCMKGILKIPNFQIPNITMGCIKSAQNTQGAKFQPLCSGRKIGCCDTKKNSKKIRNESSGS